ncbi:MAG: aminotransferase [Eggerthellaceae bacterium]|nr:aminotransferase [Eggerthellaceae bacterium]
MNLETLQQEYKEVQAKGLALNMARGKPGADQLALSAEILGALENPVAEDGTDCCNYGVLDGIPEAKRLMAFMLDDEAENVFVGGNASLTLMYDTIARFHSFGVLGSTPWNKLPNVKWLCPVPGYDRHFAITEAFGYEMIPISMNDSGPNMDEVEQLAAHDESVKGIWCVPKYSNPSGATYSDDVVRRLASMPCAASDFRIIWDNAYCVHHLYDEEDKQDQLLDIKQACIEAGNPDRYIKFASTSKVTLPGSGISAFAASPANMGEARARISIQAIGHDKLNQLRHVRFLRDGAGIKEHMKKHAAILRPKFELVLQKLEEGLAGVEGCRWTAPRGGYFISLDVPAACAKRVVQLCKEAGVVLTGAGATWPYGNEPKDSNIRIAPTLPPLDELDQALDVLVLCIKLAAAEKQQ